MMSSADSANRPLRRRSRSAGPALALLLCGLGFGCGGARDAQRPVMVLAAASATEAVEELAQRFEKRTGTPVEIVTGASSALARQIIAGAPAHVFLSAHANWTTELRNRELVADVRPLLRNELVIVVPRGNPAGVRQPEDLLSEGVTRIAVAGENVPAGVYADRTLQGLGLWERLQSEGRLARGQDVRITLGFVELGEADAGIVYSTDARISKDVEVVHTFDPSLHEPLIYPMALTNDAEQVPAAAAFYELLASPEARAVFAEHGFAPAVEEPQPAAPGTKSTQAAEAASETPTEVASETASEVGAEGEPASASTVGGED